jgi:hypothetical protein
MRFHGGKRDDQLFSDLLVGITGSDELQHLQFPAVKGSFKGPGAGFVEPATS